MSADTTTSRATYSLWPAWVILALQWFTRFGLGYFAPATFLQFFGFMLGPIVGFLLLILWWGRVSPWPRSRKLLVIAMPIFVMAITLVFADPSAYQPSYLYGVPFVSLAFVVWLTYRRFAEPSNPLLLWTALVLVTCGGWALVRSTGVDGDFAHDFEPRWTQTAEERLLESLDDAPASAADAAEKASSPSEGSPAEPATTEDAESEASSTEPTDTEGAASELASTEESAPDEATTDEATSEGMPASPAAEVADIPAVAAWPGLRGPHRDSVVPGVTLATDWSSNPPQTLWKRPVGPGWGSFAVDGDTLFTQEQRGAEEVVSAYSASTGQPLWHHADTARFQDAMAGPGPRATPTIVGDTVYTLGATGIVNALAASDGALRWQRDLVADTGAVPPEFGFSASPLVIDGQVVLHGGAPDGKGIVSYDAETGEPLWFAPAGPISYCSMHLTTLEGTRQMLVLTNDGATSVDLDGKVLWKHEWSIGGGARVVQPAFTDDGDVIIGTGFGFGLRRIEVTHTDGQWTTSEVWTATSMKPYYNDLVVHDGYAYGFDNRILSAVDLATGERAWKGGRYGNGQVLLLPEQDLLVVLSDRGEVALVAAEPDGFREIAKIEAIEGKTWNHPTLVDGVLYVRNGEEMAALRLPPG